MLLDESKNTKVSLAKTRCRAGRRGDEQVGDNSSVVRVHSGSESVEDSGNSNLDVVLSHESVGKGLEREEGRTKVRKRKALARTRKGKKENEPRRLAFPRRSKLGVRWG